MPFFHYSQNNTGGRWHLNDKVTTHVIIEAPDCDYANFLAGRQGLYFDGSGDCDCCGNRWSEAWKEKGDASPMIYGDAISSYQPWDLKKDQPWLYVYYFSGLKESYCVGQEVKREQL